MRQMQWFSAAAALAAAMMTSGVACAVPPCGTDATPSRSCSFTPPREGLYRIEATGSVGQHPSIRIAGQSCGGPVASAASAAVCYVTVMAGRSYLVEADGTGGALKIQPGAPKEGEMIIIPR